MTTNMTTKQKVKAAFKAMKEIGISEEKTKPALKKLLKVFNKNWALIEEDCYRVLADAIFEYEETETAEKEKKNAEHTERGEASEVALGLDGPIRDGPMLDETMQDEPERPLKRLRLKHQAQGPSSNGIGALKIPKPEPGEPESQPASPQPLVRNKGKQPVSSSNGTPVKEKRTVSGRPAQALQIKEPIGVASSGKQKKPQTNVLITPKDEPFTDDVISVQPLAVVHPVRADKEAPSNPANQVNSKEGERSETENGQDKQLEKRDVPERDPPTKLDIAASTHGEVKIYLTCNPGAKCHEIHMPDLETVLKKVNEHCVKAYNIMDSEFSVSEVMKQLCDCVVELGNNADGVPEDSRGE